MSKKQLTKKTSAINNLNTLALIAIIISIDLLIRDRYHTASVVLIVSNIAVNISGLSYLKYIQKEINYDPELNHLISYYVIYIMTTIAPLLEIIRIYNIFN